MRAYIASLLVHIYFLGVFSVLEAGAESTDTFPSWTQPPISSGNGEGNCTVILPEQSVDSGITLQVDGGTGKVTYKIMKEDSLSPFTLVDTGELKITRNFDMEIIFTNSVILVIRAEDESQPTHKTGTATMTVFFSDINDWEPEFSKGMYKATIPDNQAIGTSVILIKAFDRDMTSPNREVTYEIKGGNKNSDFIISTKSGRIAVGKPLSVNRTSRYFLDVIAVDGGFPQQTGSATVIIDVYEADPDSSCDTNRKTNTACTCTCRFSDNSLLTSEAALPSKQTFVLFVILVIFNRC